MTRPARRKKAIRYVANPKFSTCGSVRSLADLDFREWYMDSFSGQHSFSGQQTIFGNGRYIHVRGIGNEYAPRDTWHRVHARPFPSAEHSGVRLGMDRRGLYWILAPARTSKH